MGDPGDSDDLDYDSYYRESLQRLTEDPLSAFDYYEDGDLEDYYFDDEPPDALSQLQFLWTECTIPLLSQSFATVAPLSLFSLSLPLLGLVGGRSGVPSAPLHLSSFGLGLAALLVFFPESWHILLAIVFAAGSLFLFVARISSAARLHRASCLSAALWGTAVCLEMRMDGPTWHKLRGPALLVAMKVLSVAFDEEEAPRWERLFGYLLCPGTVIFGPWIKYSDYSALLDGSARMRWSRRWFSHFLLSLASSFFALFASVCVASVFLAQIDPPAALPSFVAAWLAAYRDAFSFRTSHYYVCFTSRATLMAIGAGTEMEEEEAEEEEKPWEEKVKDRRHSSRSNSLLEITNPLHVEFPRSLVEVVVHWNIPTHRWLKSYVFRPSQPVVGTPLAILATYAISALLHGLNFQLAAVLFSLGLYSYVEHALRSKLARIFDACILARACRGDCRHAHRPDSSWWVKLTNSFFGLAAVFHLAYLGVGFDNGAEQSRGYSMGHVVEKWRTLGFASHIVALAFGGFSLLI